MSEEGASETGAENAQESSEVPSAAAATDQGIYDESGDATETDADAAGETESQGEATEQTEEASADDATDSEQDDSEGAAEPYDAFELPEGMELDEATVAEFTPIARAWGLTQEQAQEAVSFYAGKVQQALTAQIDAALDAAITRSDAWFEEVRADKEIGSDEAIRSARLAVERFGGNDLKKALDELGGQNHPAIVRAFHRIGQAISEDQLVTTEGGGGADRPERISPDGLDRGIYA